MTQSLLNGQGAVAYPSGTRAHRTRDASGWAGTSPLDYIDARFARKLTGDGVEGEHSPLPFVGSATLTIAVVDAAERIRSTLGLSLEQR